MYYGPKFNVNFHANCTAVFVFCVSKSSGRINAKYAFEYTIKNNSTQYAKKEEKEMKEQSRDPHDDILPIQFLTRPDRA